VFEVHTPLSTEEERVVKLVEACWTRELTFGATGKVYLVGVKSLFEPGASQLLRAPVGES
jgi:hypothetical protein